MLTYLLLSSENNQKIEMYTGRCKSTITHARSKTKSQRGHSLNETWVIGAVKRTEECQLLLGEVSDRTEETFFGIIRTYTSRVYYNDQEFSYPEIGANTSSIEAIWNAIKYQIPPRNRTHSLDCYVIAVEKIQNDNFG
ncbi:hypothetical protein RF11_15660 [Thelohanellus kitauei]|uniref:ISXO2-like transposase domain-containing protein n=1 Tax=Thelohanellus kitauei TaxID=669202 RepID=A0A0C2JKF4_THEKT|nr:hypothetical protein RF11_15660 [Thelohanellus kitauei]